MPRAEIPIHRSVINLHQLRHHHTPRWPHLLWDLRVTETAWTWLVLLRKQTRRRTGLLPPMSAPRYGKKLGSLLPLFPGIKSSTSESRSDKDRCFRIPFLPRPRLCNTRKAPLLQNPQIAAHLKARLLMASRQNLRTSTSTRHKINQPLG